MDDLKRHTTKIQIFYTFVTNFDTLQKAVREMALSGEAADYMRAEGICDLVGFFVYDAKNVDEVINRIHQHPIDDKLKGLVANLEGHLKDQKDSILLQMTARHQMMLDILLLRSTIRPAEVRKAEKKAVQAARDAMTDSERDALDRQIVLRRGMQIDDDVLDVLNEIAASVINKTVLLSDYAKKFKTPHIRDIIIRAYHESSYYFEQAFSNTSVNIQFILLEIIAESLKKDPKNEEKRRYYDDLIDLHTLATIDTTANKMTSKVSDHQAFELFLNALHKSNNDYLIKKLLNDDVIMNTLFDISTRDLENYYGFRRMFTVARYPFDGIIVDRYKKLKRLSTTKFAAIVSDLSRDTVFKESWDNYEKTEKTHSFIKVLDELMSQVTGEALTDEVVQGLGYVLDEFTRIEDYNIDLLTMDVINDSLEEIYYFFIRNSAFDHYQEVQTALNDFYSYRVNNALNASRLNFKNYGGEKTFSITHLDMWYDVHKMMHRYNFTGERFYLRYDDDLVFVFDHGDRIQLYEKHLSAKNIKELPKGQHSINCTNAEGKGFDHYIFNLFGRIVRNFMSGAIHTRLLSVKTSTFRKVEIPGLSVKDDQRIHKVIYDYLTLFFLWEKNKHLFIHVYKRRIDGLLTAITSMEMENSEMRQYVQVTSNAWVLELFSYKGMVTRMATEWEMASRANRDLRILQHGDSFFQLASNRIDG